MLHYVGSTPTVLHQQDSNDERTGGIKWALEWENLVLPGCDGIMTYKGRHNPYRLLTECRTDTVGLYGWLSWI